MRRYGKWAGNERGMPENPRKCVATVPLSSRSVRFRQCGSWQGKGPGGLYCVIHAKKIEAGEHVRVPDDE